MFDGYRNIQKIKTIQTIKFHSILKEYLFIILQFFFKNKLYLLAMATPEEQAIQGVIDQIWDTYDVDKSGALDKEETKKFVQDTLGNLGSGDEFSDEAFDEVFATFDKDNSGTVEKPEMVVFIKQLLGGNWEKA